MDDLPEEFEIAEVRICAYIARSQYPYGATKFSFRPGATRYYSDHAEVAAPTGTPSVRADSCVTNPHTNLKWTTSQISGVIAGVYFGSCASYGTCIVDKLWLEVYPEGIGTHIVGLTPIDRYTSATVSSTAICLSHPSTVKGTVRLVQVYLATAMTAFKIGVFYKVSGDAPPGNGFYTSRASWNVGALDAGFHEIMVAMPIMSGDFIGCWGTGGALEADYAFNQEEAAIVAVGGGDKTACVNAEFTPASYQYAPSIRGIIYS
jgi:hypothetical protein